MKNILKERITTLIFISSLLALMLSLSGCIGDGDNTGSKDYSTSNAIQENVASNNKPNNDNTILENFNIIYPHSKPYSNVPRYYYALMGITTEGITLSVYETSDTVESILEWYENKITSLGYEVTMNATIAKISNPQGTFEYGGMIFKKGNDAIGIWVMREPTQERTIYFIGKGPADKLLGSTSESSEYTETEGTTSTIYNYEEEKPQLPTSDKASGEEPIKRYPGSVMLKYGIATVGGKKYTYIKYGTYKDPQDVFNWYNDNIKGDNDWNILYTSSSGSEYSITCGKNNNEIATIVITKGDYTTIDITYIVAQVDNQ